MVHKLLLFLWLAGAAVANCPPKEDITPHCSCRDFMAFSMMSCSNILSVDELVPPIRATEYYKIFSINIENSTLLYLPSDLFKDTKFERIRFGNSQVMALSDKDVAFEGLEDHLEEIRATGAQYITTWDWSKLRNLKKLQLVDVNDIGMYSLDNEFPNLVSLTHLGISNAQISFIHPHAFGELPNLKLLVLKRNEISEVRRNMLPNPANKLYHLDLSYNLLSTLPDDLFKNMPKLTQVDLSHNKLVTLKESIFSPLLRNLEFFRVAGNPIKCDCNMKWVIDHSIPTDFIGECSEPQELKGKSLTYLEHTDISC